MKPAYLYAKVTDEDHISLKWKWYGSTYDVSGFKIERRSVHIVDFTTIASTGDYFYIDKDIPQDKKVSYIYRVHAFKDSVVSGYSNEVRVDIGLEEIAANPTNAVVREEVQSKPTRGPAPTGYKKENPGPTSTPLRKTEPGTVWFVPDSLKVQAGAHFTTGIHINSGKQKIAAFGIIIEYSDALLDVNRNIGNNGVIPGSDGFIAAVNARDPGVLFVSGFDSYGKGPGEDLHLLTIQWRAINYGAAKFEITIRDLNDDKTTPIKYQKTIDGLVTIIEKEYAPEPEIAYYDEKWSLEQPQDPAGMNRGTDNSFETTHHHDNDNDYDDDEYYEDYNDDYDDDYEDYDDDPPYPDNPPYNPSRTSAPESFGTNVPDNPDFPTSRPTSKPIITAAPTWISQKTRAPTATPKITRAPTATPAPKPRITVPPFRPGAGDVWIEPKSQTVNIGAPFVTEVHVNTGSQKLAAYGFNVNFGKHLIDIDKTRGTNGVDAGPDGFLIAVNANRPSVLSVTGFDTSGKGPKSDLYLLNIYWKANSKGNATILITVDRLVDDKTLPVGKPSGKNGTVIVQ